VGPQYFQTIGLRLLRGRDFAANDSDSAEQFGILSVSAARTYFPNQDPLGQAMRAGDTTFRIVGVVEDAKYANLREQSPRTAYFGIKAENFCNLVIRGEQDKAAAVRQVRELLKETGKDIRLGEAVLLTEQIDHALVRERLVAMLASFFAVLAAVLVAIGLYGVVEYSAARRTNEIGVRLALGATGPGVLWLLVREAVVLSAIGIAVGIPAALFSSGSLNLCCMA
jgi:ABC-type antimicrobial peptide transport system permease subunit